MYIIMYIIRVTHENIRMLDLKGKDDVRKKEGRGGVKGQKRG